MTKTDITTSRPAREGAIPEGILFAGEGAEVQRDDMKALYGGDMEAALALARATAYRFLVYVPQVEHEDAYHPWQVLAFSRGAQAVEAAQEMGGWTFDGRRCFSTTHRVSATPPEGFHWHLKAEVPDTWAALRRSVEAATMTSRKRPRGR